MIAEQKAIEEDASDLFSHQYLALALQQLGRRQEALVVWNALRPLALASDEPVSDQLVYFHPDKTCATSHC